MAILRGRNSAALCTSGEYTGQFYHPWRVRAMLGTSEQSGHRRRQRAAPQPTPRSAPQPGSSDRIDYGFQGRRFPGLAKWMAQVCLLSRLPAGILPL